MNEITRIELPTQFGMNTVNAYLISGDEQVLIDCGEDTDDSWDTLIHSLSEKGLLISDLDRVVITHAHVDHIGMARRVAEATGLQIQVNKPSYDWAINTQSKWKMRSDLIKTFYEYFMGAEEMKGLAAIFGNLSSQMLAAWKPLEPDMVDTYDIEGTINFGREKWKILYAPGHTNTQCCFYHGESRRLISADMLLRITPTPVMEFKLDEPDVREIGILTMLDSYAMFRELDSAMVYPGHYERFDNPNDIIDRQVHRIHQRKDECLQLIQNGYNTAMKVFQKLYEGRWHGPAINMLVGYLDLLIHESKIEVEYRDNMTVLKAL